MWLERRTAYTRSTAVMSMVGYLLGLGDRHPSNLMLDRYSGKLLHIDFGDCFEASMHREKFPEKVRDPLLRDPPPHLTCLSFKRSLQKFVELFTSVRPSHVWTH